MITSAKYIKNKLPGFDSTENTTIRAIINEETWSVPIDDDNRHYREILAWVAEGNTIEPADEQE